ncbi:hypothetical protein LTR85_006601 [Meristemomyces frigidus]|nr:hypothetical protein LTR85_006601 [Meristemomyces frigidus]
MDGAPPPPQYDELEDRIFHLDGDAGSARHPQVNTTTPCHVTFRHREPGKLNGHGKISFAGTIEEIHDALLMDSCTSYMQLYALLSERGNWKLRLADAAGETLFCSIYCNLDGRRIRIEDDMTWQACYALLQTSQGAKLEYNVTKVLEGYTGPTELRKEQKGCVVQ